jgi:hypothetical protein
MLASSQLTSSVVYPKNTHMSTIELLTLSSLLHFHFSAPPLYPPSPSIVFYISESSLLQAQYSDGSLRTLRFMVEKVVLYGYYHEFTCSFGNACKEAKYAACLSAPLNHCISKYSRERHHCRICNHCGV